MSRLSLPCPIDYKAWVIHGMLFAGLAFGLFTGMLVCLAIGRRFGVRRLAQDPEGAQAGISAIDGSVFALVGLLIAFTFSGAATRFDGRRHLIAEEANAIGTAWLRLDLLTEADQPALRELFRGYLDARIAAFRSAHDMVEVRALLDRSAALQSQIWSGAVEACRAPGMKRATILLLPALNQMIDITTTRRIATESHPPQVIYTLLFTLTLTAALLAGYDMAGGKRRNWLHMIGFAATMALAIYVILDIEYPRRGFIRVDEADHVLIELRASMD